MPPKNTEKKLDSLKELQKSISPILVINNPTLKPYIELFEYAPENIYQKPLGNLVGFFEIKEYSEQSSYVVNFLTSVLKKEYYTNPRRSVAESFDSALHKVNLALSEVAKHGHVDWIGKLHASICVLEKNAVHFTITGEAKIFLNRKGVLTEISEGLSSEESEPHPLKTFINVSSGRLEKNDKLIITSNDIFHILTLNDLKKNLIRLGKPQFVQFLKTALSNELEMMSTIVVDLEEAAKNTPVAKIVETEMPIEEVVNVFSQTAFAKEKPLIEEDLPATKIVENQTDYTDQKTGHIYVQGEAPPAEISQAQHYWEETLEKIVDLWHFSKSNWQKNLKRWKKQLAKKITQAKIKAQIAKQEREKNAKLEAEKERQLAAQQEAEQALLMVEQEALEVAQEKNNLIALEKTRPINDVRSPIIQNEPTQAPVNLPPTQSLIDDSPEELTIEQLLAKTEAVDMPTEKEFESSTFAAKIQWSTLAKDGLALLQKINHILLSGLTMLGKKISVDKDKFPTSTLVPHFSKLKQLYTKFSTKQKIGALLALLAIFVVPIFIANWLDRPKPATIQDLTKVENVQDKKIISEKNLKTTTQAKKLFANANLIATLTTNSGTVIATPQSLVVLKENGQAVESSLPANVGKITACTHMADLSMILILTDQNKVFSFMLNTSKFAENKIDASGISAQSLIGTYLTYLYVLNPASNQINRYPRAEGGFGEKISWLKESADLQGASQMTVDDSIYLVQNNQVLKFFKGKKVSLVLESANTPVRFDKIFASLDSQFLYALDNQNSRLVQYDKTSGAILAQFSNDIFKTATTFTVDEKTKTAFVTNKEGLSSVALQ